MLNQLNITTVWIFLIAGTQLLQPKEKKNTFNGGKY